MIDEKNTPETEGVPTQAAVTQLTPADFEPHGDVILVKPEEPDLLRKSGIQLLSGAALEKPNIGTIISVGPGKAHNGIPLDIVLKIVTIVGASQSKKEATDQIQEEIKKLQAVPFVSGEKIVYGKFSGTKIKIGEEEFLTMRANDILFTIHERKGMMQKLAEAIKS